MKPGSRIRERRLLLGLSVADVAAALGKNRATVYRLSLIHIFTRGKCRLRDFFVYPVRSIGSLCAIFLCVDLLIVIVTFGAALPSFWATLTYDRTISQFQAVVQSTDALTPRMLVLHILSILLSLPRYAALGFLYERAVPASTSE